MPRPPAPRPGEKPTREHILDVALELFVEQGFDGTSLREIADRMGFTKAALYYHFESKDDILLALHLRLHALGRDTFAGLELDTVSAADWPEIFDRFIDQLAGNRQLFELHTRNQKAFERLHDKAHSEDHADLQERLQALLRDPDVPAEQRVRLAATFGAIVSSLLFASDAFSDIATDELRGLLREVTHDIIGSGQ